MSIAVAMEMPLAGGCSERRHGAAPVMLQVTATLYGGPAYEGRREVVGAAKQRDSLAPVTQIVPTNLCRRWRRMRRRLWRLS